MYLNRLDEAAHIMRCMTAEQLLSAFNAPYAVSYWPTKPLPPVHAPKRMTYDEAWEQAGIHASEIVGCNSPDWDDMHERCFDKLCIKHNIE